MLRLKTRPTSLALPTRKELKELLSYLTPQQKQELDLLLAKRSAIDWLPQPGPQTLAYNSLAQMLLYGGAAGGGKTDLLLGLAYRKHHKAIIYRREFTQFGAMIDRSHEIFDDGGKFHNSAQDRHWSFTGAPGKKLSFGAVANLGDEKKYQGHPHDMKGFDELTHFARSQFDYLRGWLRSTKSNITWQIVATCNPPNKAEERWIYEYWPNWIDKKRFPELEVPGKLIYFIMHDGKSVQVDGPGAHTYKGEESTAMSRTFIPSSVRDNMYYDDGQYASVLQSLPEPLRTQLLMGDFQAGISDDPYQLIPTEWVLLAQARWRERSEPEGKVIQAGVDVSRGGRDQTIITPRKGNYVCSQVVFPGKAITNGDACARAVLPHVSPETMIVVDVIGVGTSAFDTLQKLHRKEKVVAFVGSGESVATDQSGYLHFVNARAEGYWKLRDMLNPTSGMDMAIPDDPELLADLCAVQFKLVARGIQIISKEELIEELQRSPDKGDSCMYACVTPFRRGQGYYDFMGAEYKKAEDFKAKNNGLTDLEKRMAMIVMNDPEAIKNYRG